MTGVRAVPTLRAVFVGACLVFFLAPIAVIVPMSLSNATILYFPPESFSLRWYQAFFDSALWRAASLNSILLAVGTAGCATLLGVPCALGLMRLSPRIRAATTAFMLLPAILPTIVSAVAIYSLFAAIGLSGSLLGILLSHTMLALPFVVIYVLAALQKLDPRMVQAARSLGAGPRQAFFLVTVPSILPGICAGLIFAFVTSFGEIVVALFLSSPRSVTLPVQMWNGIRFEINPVVAAGSVIFMLISIVMFLITLVMTKRRS